MSKINFIHVPKTGGRYFHHCVLKHNKKKIKDLGHEFCYQTTADNWKAEIQSTKYHKKTVRKRESRRNRASTQMGHQKVTLRRQELPLEESEKSDLVKRTIRPLAVFSAGGG